MGKTNLKGSKIARAHNDFIANRKVIFPYTLFIPFQSILYLYGLILVKTLTHRYTGLQKNQIVV